ncbi:2-octaprenyl-3-methyl-6-methoxy-1,4-benzoquinone hydroxylase [Desulfosarcina ovata subsp. sediminis]|uniref:2-octaprenyl-3-methyl-6-methoxy-1,4-benzoquinone hydroxylase n=1 Tax=Desulfosarcina ovata subsp. sediminis TaxID=885957 RepID=A0A5K7ZWE1_9BACT|nr:AarF/UbiB family protein [Desulfosarcina ovata]BBO84575.1 2-octaprenyl-3-methyl-6-methoxy-1,4-benzoquinone hydroxylase [Desulfosarcina ovata subsp. sediminis]
MPFPFSSRRISGIRHFGLISRVLIKHGMGEVADRLKGGGSTRIKSGLPDPVRIRRTLEELGPSFIKLGQLMSTRGDLFPPEYIDELTKLQDQVPPVPFDSIRTLIESDLGEPLDQLFESIDEEALAAASVAQVHAARLKTGEKVAVKVIRPGIDKRIRKDIQVMYYFAARFERTFDLGRIIGAVNLVKEFERSIFRELDMLVEAGNIERFSRSFKDVEEIYIPRVHWDHTSRSVLVMEHIDGIKMDHVEEIRQQGIDPEEVAMIGLRSFSRQLMEAGIFHADPHPGNTLVMRDGRVSLVDFGIVGYLDEETMMQIAHLFLGFSEHDYDMVMEAFEAAGLVNPRNMDLKSFRADLKDMAEPFYGRSLKTISVKDVYDEVMRLVFKYRIRLPRNLLLLFKTFIQTEALGKILGSEASLLEVTRPYAKRLLQKGYEAHKVIKNMGRDAKLFGGYLRQVPQLAHGLFKRLAIEAPQFEISHAGLDEPTRKFENSINRLTLGLVTAASLIAAALILNSSRKILVFEIDFFGVQTLSVTDVLGISGYVIATVLGLWLVFSIIRSGKL